MDKSYSPSRLVSRQGGDTGRPGPDRQRLWMAILTPVDKPHEAVVCDGEEASSSSSEGKTGVISPWELDLRTSPCGHGLGDGHT